MKSSQFSERLFLLRHKRGFTQLEMAEAIGVARQTYLDMEDGSTVPRLDKVEALAAKLEVKPEYLAYGGSVQMSNEELKADNKRLNKMLTDIKRITSAGF